MLHHNTNIYYIILQPKPASHRPFTYGENTKLGTKLPSCPVYMNL